MGKWDGTKRAKDFPKPKKEPPMTWTLWKKVTDEKTEWQNYLVLADGKKYRLAFSDEQRRFAAGSDVIRLIRQQPEIYDQLLAKMQEVRP
jgi:hypothetical protein